MNMVIDWFALWFYCAHSIEVTLCVALLSQYASNPAGSLLWSGILSAILSGLLESAGLIKLTANTSTISETVMVASFLSRVVGVCICNHNLYYVLRLHKYFRGLYDTNKHQQKH